MSLYTASIVFLTVGGVSMESCSACPAGHYCSSEGLASPSGPCSAGFYCPFNFSSTTPYAFLCPKVCLFTYTSIYASAFFVLFYVVGSEYAASFIINALPNWMRLLGCASYCVLFILGPLLS